MEWHRETKLDQNGMEETKVVHDSGKHSFSIFSYGATVTSYEHNERQVLFVSEKAILNGTKAIRGGVPIVFPQFGQPSPSMPQHGIARTSIWTVDTFLQNETTRSASLVLKLTDSPESFLLWPYKFQLTYTVTISVEGLNFSLVVSNTDPETSFSCNALFHTYFKVEAIRNVSIRGFQNTFYANKLEDNKISLMDGESPITFEQEIDCIHLSKPDHLIGNIVLQRTADESSPITIIKSAYVQDTGSIWKNELSVDVVVWNPWIEKSKTIADLHDDAYHNFVCIEPGIVSELVTVPPHHLFVLEQSLIPGGQVVVE